MTVSVHVHKRCGVGNDTDVCLINVDLFRTFTQMLDPEATKRYCQLADDGLKPPERGSKVQVGQEDREITVLPHRKTDELDAGEMKVTLADSCSYRSPYVRLKDFCPRPRGLINFLVTEAFLFTLLFGVVWSVTGVQCLPGGNLFGLVVLFTCAVLGGRLMGMIQLPTLPPFPPLLGMLLAGLLLRNVPYVTDAVFIHPDWSSALRNIALSIILTRAGLGLDPTSLQRLKAVCLRLAIGPCVVEACTVAVVSHFLLRLPWVWGFILGFVLAAVSPAVVVPSMLLLQKEGYGVEKGIPTLLMAAGSFDDILAITGFSTCLGIAFASGSTWMNILKGLLEVVGGIIVGVVLGVFLWCFPSDDQEDVVLRRTLMLLGMSIFSVFFSHVVGYAGAGGLCVLVLAFLAGVGWKSEKVLVAAMVGHSWDVFQPLLFGLIGAQITIQSLSPNTVGLGVACLLVGLLVRVIITFALVHFGGFTVREKLFIAVAWLPKATVQAAIGSKALDMAREDRQEELMRFGLDVLTIAVLAIIITAPIGALGIGLAGPHLLQQQIKGAGNELWVQEDIQANETTFIVKINDYVNDMTSFVHQCGHTAEDLIPVHKSLNKPPALTHFSSMLDVSTVTNSLICDVTNNLHRASLQVGPPPSVQAAWSSARTLVPPTETKHR
ncbi:sodium/hydrogen exchanger 9B2-like [Thalassophryne amazonica]|uniref:sodium/hydrogen exchanger 9B2-like n=1 Tax=Thalassophryne amazonica TaxID=390379 RepID=UPI0014725AD0|nr:sodium/hydrogen exchanger 9B2-like [Thalassophryne amazonica]